MFAFGCWAGIKMFLHEKGACQNDTVKGQSRSDSLLLSPYHWAKLFRGS